MTKKVTFLHAADVHLGAPMRGFRGLTDEWAARLARAIPESFNRVIETALARRVDFVVLSGDIDIGHHMNNVAYARSLFNCFSSGELKEMNVSQIELS